MTKEQIAEGQRAASAFSAVDEVKGKEATELAERLKDTEAKHNDIGFATNPLYLWELSPFSDSASSAFTPNENRPRRSANPEF
jgi:hypothetical protein